MSSAGIASRVPYLCLQGTFFRAVLFILSMTGMVGSRDVVYRIAPSPFLLFRHFFAVALYSIWVLFVHPRQINRYAEDEKPIYARPSLDEYPALCLRSFQAVSLFMIVDVIRQLLFGLSDADLIDATHALSLSFFPPLFLTLEIWIRPPSS